MPANKGPIVEKDSLRFTFPKELHEAFSVTPSYVIDRYPNGVRRIDAKLLLEATFTRTLAAQVEAGNVEVVVRAVSG
jgi:hypothetical protein